MLFNQENKACKFKNQQKQQQKNPKSLLKTVKHDKKQLKLNHTMSIKCIYCYNYC